MVIRDKWLFEISKVEIKRVDCTFHISQGNAKKPILVAQLVESPPSDWEFISPVAI